MSSYIGSTSLKSKLSSSFENLKSSSNNTSENGSNNNTSQDNSNGSKDSNTAPEIDINTILKMKQVMEAMNSNKDDPRANLLLSLKPYLKKSRQDKVEQYVKLFGIGKAFEAFGSLGGDVKHELWTSVLSAF